ncbi:hypothetical protein ISN45_Aa02g010700 [Arabidopsis thaliana x Arabidopsis arenosa]|uniref:Uncharacterized protein n=1 Tax=Arabidopsis thaliana x Arabidopsis arenosa TaxID=1240361 RepID=A0A8T2BII3_9BRAS|nr:hypothetical protein ISN45_Aa02g010700 [Arabidopsis thaliana x Arabidopsis arenosa]
MKIMRKDGYCAAQIELEEHRQHEQLLKRENEFLNLDELNLKLRRADVSVSRAEEEFACYRASSGKNSYSNFDKTNKLSAKRKETEEERMHLLCLYKSILKDINITHAKHKAASVTGEALEQLKKKLGLLERKEGTNRGKASKGSNLSELYGSLTAVKGFRANKDFEVSHRK